MERRKHQRFKAKDGSFAILKSTSPITPGQMNNESMDGVRHEKLPTKFAKLIDISGNGLAFYYIENQKRCNRLAELDLIFANDAFYLDKILIKSTTDFEIHTKIRPSFFAIRRCGVKFSKLKRSQKTRLGYFLRNYTINEIAENPCTIPTNNSRFNKSPQLEYFLQN